MNKLYVHKYPMCAYALYKIILIITSVLNVSSPLTPAFLKKAGMNASCNCHCKVLLMLKPMATGCTNQFLSIRPLCMKNKYLYGIISLVCSRSYFDKCI